MAGPVGRRDMICPPELPAWHSTPPAVTTRVTAARGCCFERAGMPLTQAALLPRGYRSKPVFALHRSCNTLLANVPPCRFHQDGIDRLFPVRATAPVCPYGARERDIVPRCALSWTQCAEAPLSHIAPHPLGSSRIAVTSGTQRSAAALD